MHAAGCSHCAGVCRGVLFDLWSAVHPITRWPALQHCCSTGVVAQGCTGSQPLIVQRYPADEAHHDHVLVNQVLYTVPDLRAHTLAYGSRTHYVVPVQRPKNRNPDLCVACCRHVALPHVLPGFSDGSMLPMYCQDEEGPAFRDFRDKLSTMMGAQVFARYHKCVPGKLCEPAASWLCWSRCHCCS